MRCVIAMVPWAKMVLPHPPERNARARNSFPAEIKKLEPLSCRLALFAALGGALSQEGVVREGAEAGA